MQDPCKKCPYNLVPVAKDNLCSNPENNLCKYWLRYQGYLEGLRQPRKIKLHVGVEVYQLNVAGVHVFTDEKEAEEWFEGYTKVSYQEYRERITEENADVILGEEFDETKLFEVEISCGSNDTQ